MKINKEHADFASTPLQDMTGKITLVEIMGEDRIKELNDAFKNCGIEFRGPSDNTRCIEIFCTRDDVSDVVYKAAVAAVDKLPEKPEPSYYSDDVVWEPILSRKLWKIPMWVGTMTMDGLKPLINDFADTLREETVIKKLSTDNTKDADADGI